MKKAPAPERAKRRAHGHCNTGQHQAERLDAIRIALLERGIEPADSHSLISRLHEAEGKVRRFATVQKPHSKNGWLIAYHDQGQPFVVVAGDWATGAEMKWVAGNTHNIPPQEERALKQRIAEARKVRQEEQAQQWQSRASVAVSRWNSCTPADPQHPYLQNKGIKPSGARQDGQLIILPLTDFEGKIWSLQTIDHVGNKRLMAGGKKAGNFILVNGHQRPTRVLICEGWATGCTLAEIEQSALVLAAADCNNLRAVAIGTRKQWPDTELIICGDDDRQTTGNPGAAAAQSAALAAGGRFALPDWPPEAPMHLSDFNDLHKWQRGQK